MKTATRWDESLFQLIRRTSVDLPVDVEAGLRALCRREPQGSRGRWALETMLANVAAARANDAPICQDTGTLIFYFQVPAGSDTLALARYARRAVARATRAGYLRENTIDTVTGRPHADNVAPGAPVLIFEPERRRDVAVRLVLKGGGCENVGIQYSLPDATLDAGRDLEGVRRCLLDAVWRAQGRGCAPGVLGVCIGGDRATGYEQSKRQFLRLLGDRSAMPALARLEARVTRAAQGLGIGPMGLGGRSTLLGVKIGAVSRVPASYFVTVSYMCWACRRRGAALAADGSLRRWLYA